MKNWWFKFDFKVWRTDSNLRRCSLEARAFWLECLCVMHEVGGAELKGSPDELARLLGCFPEEVTRNAVELKRTGTAEVKIGDGEIVLKSRRLYREIAEREGARKRQIKFRENGGGDPERWTAIRAVILTRDGKRCAYCAKYAATVDHIIPRAQGGLHTDENLVAACKKCNEKKNNRTPEQAGMSFHATFSRQQLASNTQVTEQSKSNKKEVINKNKEEEREEAADAAHALDNPMLAVYHEFFPEATVAPFLQDLIYGSVKNEPIWRRSLAFWKTNHYRAQSVGKLIDRYNEDVEGKHNGNGAPKRLSMDVGKPTESLPPPTCKTCHDLKEVSVPVPEDRRQYSFDVEFISCPDCVGVEV